jgi:L-alanine-DL-glutamate epimerase-like enolase superfamily enzyme
VNTGVGSVCPEAASVVDSVEMHYTRFPLIKPYKLSFGALEKFDPIIVEVRGPGGESGWGEVLIVPGYTPETVRGTWDLCCQLAASIVGRDIKSAAAVVIANLQAGPGAASAMLSALEMLARDSILVAKQDIRVPLLAPCQAHKPTDIDEEVQQLLAEGYRTLKVKVGYDWQQDLERVCCVQQAVNGRATIRLDANRGYDESAGKAFASRLDPKGIELFEQPCGSEDWKANAAVASVSTVPVMLDESIYGLADIDRAATIHGVGFVKLKLKKIGGLTMLETALARIRAHGLTPVLGDGVSMEIGCWMEACVAARSITNAGEMNGFLKARQRLFAQPLRFDDGAIVIPGGYWPEVDRRALAAHVEKSEHFPARSVAQR